jgi:hypothetical protein
MERAKTNSLFQFHQTTQMHFCGDKVHAEYHTVKCTQSTVTLIFGSEKFHSKDDSFLLYNNVPTAEV